ncbi:SDR family oxidoreductase [Porticoccaceae bacterium]|jgi:NAD(P)-dependent dehydrogenase (short-subunit alcohol dehydrogenase family)|nr:SDR family oxidoreductase [Porticoccaceae bacterium]
MDIKNKVALITGGASGLGEATARSYVEKGAKVVIMDMNDERGHALSEELGDEAIYIHTDVTQEDNVAGAVDEAVSHFGAIHICNNFAGIGGAHKTVGRENVAYPLDHWKKVIDINLVGTFNVLRLAAVQMSSQEPVTECGSRGVIINTASVAGYEGQIGQSAYAASKGGIIGMTICLARDLAEYGIRVNTIAPGLIHTPIFNKMPEHIFNALEATVLFPKRLGRAEEIAHLACYIVESDYTNGETIRMDGGIRMTPR